MWRGTAIWQWMFGFNLPSFDGQAERDTTHAQVSRRFSETQPTFCFTAMRAVTGDAMVTAQRDHPFPRPAIPPSGEQSVASESAMQSYRRSRSALALLRLRRSLSVCGRYCGPVAGEAGAIPCAPLPSNEGRRGSRLPDHNCQNDSDCKGVANTSDLDLLGRTKKPSKHLSISPLLTGI